MANPPKEHRFKKGQSGNPKGRPPKLLSHINNELKAHGYERVTPSQIAEAYEILFGLDEEQIKEFVTDKKSPMFLRIVAKRMLSKDGHEMVEKMLDRAHGKAKQQMDITSDGEKMPVPQIILNKNE